MEEWEQVQQKGLTRRQEDKFLTLKPKVKLPLGTKPERKKARVSEVGEIKSGLIMAAAVCLKP